MSWPTPNGRNNFVADVPELLPDNVVWPSTPSAAAPLGLLAALSNRRMRLLSRSGTHSRPVVGSTVSRRGELIPVLPLPGLKPVKVDWPSTPSAVAPFALPAALLKRRTRWLSSETHNVPLASTATPQGVEKVLWLAPPFEPVNVVWPSTPSAAAPLGLLAALLNRSTRLLSRSTTHRRPLLSTATSVGAVITLAVVL